MPSIGKILTKIFGSRNDRLLKRYRSTVAEINQWEPRIRAMSDAQLRARTQDIRQAIRDKSLTITQVIPEALAIMRESMDRHIGIREIFNPEQNFDPDKFDDECLNLYDQVQQQMIATGQSWQTVPIPHKLYDAVRALYPESRPPFRARCFDVQLIGGLVLYEGKIAEMATGEGKTFVAPLACFLKVLEGWHCHVVTVNDYLVRRDAMWVRPAFENLGLTVGYIQADMDPGGEGRRRQYQCDITYGTNSEFGFDYLRDNMKERVELQVQGPLDFAIVDEVDSILIDEARTPLIISGAARDDAPKYRAADEVARKIIELHKPYAQAERAVEAAKRAMKAAEGDADKAKTREEKEQAEKKYEQALKQLEEAEAKKAGLTAYYEVEWDRKSVHLTHEGIAAAQEAAGVGSFYVGQNMDWPHLMEQALRAHVVYEKDKDYVVDRNPRTGEIEVIIVDEYTGRKMVGRQWSDGLHQAVEAKERVAIKQETQTLATITLQNFFKLYRSLAGMTGTAQTEAEEFAKIYKLEVVTIPTNRPVIRKDYDDRIYRTEQEKWEAIIEEIKEVSDAGRPVLVGTTSVEKSERLSQMLTRKYGIQHEVLNAKQHEREAHIVAQAGRQHKNAHGQIVGNVTIATNMAGRGTDIKLIPETHQAGGLHVIGTERHTARRIDNQLRGRSGRQGDPGSSRFYVSLQDDLLKMFMGDWTVNVFKKIGMQYGEAIESPMLTRGILRAQKKVEERNFLARKNLLEYDEVMDHQRTVFYGMRQKVLEGRDVDQIIWDMIGQAIEDAVRKYIVEDYVAANVAEWARTNFGVSIETEDVHGMRKFKDLEDYIKSKAANDIETNLATTLQEYIGEDWTDQTGWDIKGLQSWAMSSFQVQLSQAEIRKMQGRDVEERLREAALEQIEKRDCAPLLKYLEPDFPVRELCNWAMQKFDIRIDMEQLLTDDRSRPYKSPEEIVELIEQEARKAYQRREIEYPIDHVLAYVCGGIDGLTVENPYAADFLRNWAMAKYRVEIPLSEIQSQSVRKLRDRFIGLQEKFLLEGELEREVDALLARHTDPAELARAAAERFHTPISEEEIRTGRIQSFKGSRVVADIDDDGQITPRDLLLMRGRQFLRRELTQLEQFVLIQIFDQTWKDHLYAMDMLKGGIGLNAFAQMDPRVVYKKQGYEFFQQMLASVRDKVTDLIFRARVVGPAEARSAYQVTATQHQTTDSYGVGENLAAVQAGQPQPDTQPEQAPTRVATIVRESPKVGRNDPCPCGSGKKYKKCCGQDVT